MPIMQDPGRAGGRQPYFDYQQSLIPNFEYGQPQQGHYGMSQSTPLSDVQAQHLHDLNSLAEASAFHDSIFSPYGTAPTNDWDVHADASFPIGIDGTYDIAPVQQPMPMLAESFDEEQPKDELKPDSPIEEGSDQSTTARARSVSSAGRSHGRRLLARADFDIGRKRRRSNSEDSDGDCAPAAPEKGLGPVSSLYAVPPRPKPGRKPAVDKPSEKRKAQNREAQRAFRDRKVKHTEELKSDVQNSVLENRRLSADLSRTQAEMEHSRSKIDQLKKENQQLRVEMERLNNENQQLRYDVGQSRYEIVRLTQEKEQRDFNATTSYNSNPSRFDPLAFHNAHMMGYGQDYASDRRAEVTEASNDAAQGGPVQPLRMNYDLPIDGPDGSNAEMLEALLTQYK